MGGYGSGYRYDAKHTNEDYRSIDVRDLHRRGLTRPQHQGIVTWRRKNMVTGRISFYSAENEIRFVYTHTSPSSDKSSLDYRVQLSWSDCHLGGKRPWFLCSNCNKRVAILYCAKYFVCRHCLKLNYQSTRERSFDRAARQAVKIRERLGWQGGVLSSTENKPKAMHWQTFNRLMTKYEKYSQKSFKGMRQYLGLQKGAWGGELEDEDL